MCFRLLDKKRRAPPAGLWEALERAENAALVGTGQ